MLKDDAIYNSSFRFRNINLNNIIDINLAINIIVIIAMTFFEIFIVAVFVFEFIIVIVINVNLIVVAVIVIVIISFVIAFERFVFKLIVFDLDIKDCFTINASFDKSQNLTIVEIFDRAFLRIDDDVSLP